MQAPTESKMVSTRRKPGDLPVLQKIDVLAPGMAIALGVILVFGVFGVVYVFNLTWWLAPALLAGLSLLLLAWFGQPVARLPVNVQQTEEVDHDNSKQKEGLSRLPRAVREDLALVRIPSGNFQMGSPTGEGFHNEYPRHRVALSSFYLGVFPVTQRLYREVRGRELLANSDLSGRTPEAGVSWHDAVAFCNALSVRLGREPCYQNEDGACDRSRNGFRLPSEAEWEYAARAGTTTQYALPAPGGSDDFKVKGLANCDGCGGQWDGKQTAPVGSFKPNGWGLHEMHGNVWEWTQDKWHDNYEGAPDDGTAWENPSGSDDDTRVLRGGSWYFVSVDARSAVRLMNNPVIRGFNFGFRVLCSGPL